MDQNGRKHAVRVRGAGMALLLALFLAGAIAAEEPAGPRILFEEMRFDFGNVKQGEMAVHVFEFRNGGDAVLEIQKVQTS